MAGVGRRRPDAGGDAADTGNRQPEVVERRAAYWTAAGATWLVRLDQEQPLGEELRSRKWRFYRAPGGGQVVKEELQKLETEARAEISEAMNRVRRLEHFNYELEAIDNELKAVRVFFKECTYRILFAQEGEHDTILLALHVTKKKSRKLSINAKRLAKRRLKSWRERGEDLSSRLLR